MNVLLTGATGYLGNRLLAALTRGGRHEVVAATRASSRTEKLQVLPHPPRIRTLAAGPLSNLLDDERIDVIMHCATNYGRGAVPRPDVVEANLVLPLRLLDGAARCSRRIAFVNTDTMLDKNVSDYSLSKRQFREWLQVFSDAVPAVNVRVEHFFGPGDDPTKFVTFVLHSLLRREKKIPLTLGEQERDFIYVDDVVSALLVLAEFAGAARDGFHEFEIGRGEPISVRTFVETAKRLCGNDVTTLAFGELPYRPHEVMRVMADTARLRALGWAPRFDIVQALNLTIAGERT